MTWCDKSFYRIKKISIGFRDMTLRERDVWAFLSKQGLKIALSSKTVRLWAKNVRKKFDCAKISTNKVYLS